MHHLTPGIRLALAVRRLRRMTGTEGALGLFVLLAFGWAFARLGIMLWGFGYEAVKTVAFYVIVMAGFYYWVTRGPLARPYVAPPEAVECAPESQVGMREYWLDAIFESLVPGWRVRT